MRKTVSLPIKNTKSFKKKILLWAAAHETAVYLDNNTYPDTAGHGQWECLVGAGASDFLQKNAGEKAFESFKEWKKEKNDWLFGFFGYDLKNEVENLCSKNFDGIDFPDLYFFQPEIVCGIKDGVLHIFSIEKDPKTVWESIKAQKNAHTATRKRPSAIKMHPRFPKPEYLQTVEKIRQDIVEGDYYEINLCQEFYAEQVDVSPIDLFDRLNQLGKAPFSAFFKTNDRYLCSASPERFLQKKGNQLLSQPIKGTRKRGKNPEEDADIAASLALSVKDRAENVMIVDLVRNDLARNCMHGSVKVTDLFGIYPFETVFQMISTVTGTLRPETDAVDAIKAAFPPGSMTGAPKVMAMQRIEAYEKTKRGLYSGTVGYFDPEENFDFNVVIRSILYNEKNKYLSFQVGGAIVYDSVPEQEYEECILKAQGMLKVLGGE